MECMNYFNRSAVRRNSTYWSILTIIIIDQNLIVITTTKRPRAMQDSFMIIMAGKIIRLVSLAILISIILYYI